MLQKAAVEKGSSSTCTLTRRLSIFVASAGVVFRKLGLG